MQSIYHIKNIKINGKECNICRKMVAYVYITREVWEYKTVNCNEMIKSECIGSIIHDMSNVPMPHLSDISMEEYYPQNNTMRIMEKE